MTDRYDPRLIGVFGAAMLSSGLVLSSLAQNVIGLNLGYSMLPEFGWGILVVVPSVTMNPRHELGSWESTFRAHFESLGVFRSKGDSSPP